jgi:hypothetical protein
MSLQDKAEVNTNELEENEKPSSWSDGQKQRLLADAITIKSPLEDIKTILKCGANVNEPVKKVQIPINIFILLKIYNKITKMHKLLYRFH